MNSQVVPLFVFLLVTSGIGISVAIYAWQRRQRVPGAIYFTFLMLAMAEWALTSALEKTGATLSARVLWSRIQYIGIGSTTPLLLLFCLVYTQQDRWLGRRGKLLLWIIPTISVILAFTNDLHGLIWKDIYPAPGSLGTLLIYEHGAWFWVQMAYSYALLMTSTLALVWAILRSPQTYHRQSAALMVGAALPWIGNILYVTGFVPVRGLDPTSPAFTLSGVVIAWGIFRLQFLDLVPVARGAVIESMSDGLLVLDQSNRLIDINPKAMQMLNITSAPPIGQNAGAVLQDWPDLVERYRNVKEAQAEISMITTHTPVDLELRISPLNDHQGEQVGRVVLLRNISERKQTERMRDDLTRTIVHDLRNPLSTIITSLEMLDMEGSGLTPPAERGAVLRIAKDSAQRMSELVNSILEISRLEEGRMPLVRVPESMQILAAEVIQYQMPLAENKAQDLLNCIPDDLPPVMIDVSLIGRVLQNLIDNAIKFTPNGGKILLTGRYTPGKPQVSVAVSDSGPGISLEMQPRLFQKFASGTDKGHGSGLGLAFCRLVVEAHGGHIRAESRDGKGTTFTFTLPIADKTLPEVGELYGYPKDESR